MIKIISIFLFILWLLGVFHAYATGWSYHWLLIASIVLFFGSVMHNRRKLYVTEMMKNDELSEADVEQVKEIMNENKLSEREAIELLRMHSKSRHTNSHDLIHTESNQIKEIMNENGLDQQDAVELLSVRLKLDH